MKIFCLSIYNENYELFKHLDLIPVGLGTNNFDNVWLKDENKINISDKNKNFGEYTFHYFLWKNDVLDLNNEEWIGFCSYRRFWTKKNKESINIKNLKKNILRKPENHWNNYDVILGEPLIFKKVKNIKLIKRNFLEVIKKPSVLFKNTTLRDHFNIFHGSFFLNEALNLLDVKNKKDFDEYLDNYFLNPYNMFICKNKKILFAFYEEIFPWLFKCENLFKDLKLKGYDKERIYGFLAERYMPFWFQKNFKTTVCQISYYDTHKEL